MQTSIRLSRLQAQATPTVHTAMFLLLEVRLDPGLTATITVAGGVVSSVTNVANSTLQEYQIGDILSAADSNLAAVVVLALSWK